MQTVNERIKQLREKLGFKQAQFGEKIAIAQTYLSQIENGSRKPTEKIILLVCHTFNASEKWLRDGEGEMFDNNQTTTKNVIDHYGFDEIVGNLLKTYNQLDNTRQAIVLDYARDFIASFATPSSAKSSIKAQVDSYEAELMAEAQGGAKSSASQATNEKNA